MKTIGLIGGMSWESTITYYNIINKVVKQELGGFHSAKCILYSVDFHEIEECQAKGQWDQSGELLAAAARSLEKAGADFIIICTNTMHKVIDIIKRQISIPILHIADATAEELNQRNIKKVALLGTKYTMQQDFYKSILIEKGIDVLIPGADDIEIVNDIIYNELCMGIVSNESKNDLLRMIELLTSRGAEGIVLGCTEIGLLIRQEDSATPLFDTSLIHANRAAMYAIS